MQWNSDNFAGFSTAKPWLPIAKDATLRNVAVQQKDPLSLWNWYRQLLQLRKTHPALKYGTVKILDHYPPESLAYMRIHEQETILVCINFSPKTIEIPMAQHYTILAGSALGTSLNNHLRLPAYSGVVILDKTHS
jgi:glycosidase